MKMVKRVKPTNEKLNAAQLEAINQAVNGNYMSLLQRVFETDRAISRVEAVRQEGTHRWCDEMVRHYKEIGEYMFSFLPHKESLKAFTDQYEYIGRK